ncbi:peptidylprolyl isomerase [Pirellulaceae bacterium SH449]
MICRIRNSTCVLLCLVSLFGCQTEPPTSKTAMFDDETKKQPRRVMVQHCLISFDGGVPGATRSRDEAQKLAEQLFEQAKSGADFHQMVKQYSDDPGLGIYKLVNFGIPVDPVSGASGRDTMVKGFGDMSFSLQVDEIGLCPYDSNNSRYGWHIIKRLE